MVHPWLSWVGTFSLPAVGCYLIGIAVQVPFLSNTLFTGPVAALLGGVDISWIVGLVVVCPLYYVWVRAAARNTSSPVLEPGLQPG